MKKVMLGLLALAVAGTGCQQRAPATVPLAAPVAQAAPVAAAATAAKAPLLPDSLTPAMKAMLRRVNLVKLVSATKTKQGAYYQPVLDGFFGANPQRLSLAMLQATRDSLLPGRLHVVGKILFKQQISRFEGIIQLTSLADYYEQGLLLSQGDEALAYVQDSTNEAGGYIANARAYSATGSFSFTNTAPPAYTLAGQVLLDFWVTDKGEVGFMNAPAQGEILEKAPTKGSGLVLKGTWQAANGEAAKPFLVSQNIFLLAPGLLSDFGVGERSASVNPKYAKLGWSNYWENDEWWADSPKPAPIL